MPGTIGNTNSSKNNRLWSDTIRRACVQNDGKLLRELAEALIEKALEGDIMAIKEVGDRLEGKPVARTELTGQDGNPIETKWLVQIVQVSADAASEANADAETPRQA